jgi:hypothetical protein
MASSSSVDGMSPASESFVAFTRTMTRISSLLQSTKGHAGLSIHTTNERRLNRHTAGTFWAK